MALWTLALLAGAAAASAQPATPLQAEPATDNASALSAGEDPWEITTPAMEAKTLPPRGGSALHSGGRVGSGTQQAGSWLRTTGALAGVVALIVLLGWGYRTVTGQGGGLRNPLRPSHAGLIEVVSRATLAPRQSVCLVRVGPRLVLVGMSQDSVRALDVIEDADLTARLLGAATRHRPDSSTSAFNRCLDEQARGYDGAEDEGAEDFTPDAGRIQELKTKLAGTIARLRGTATGV